MTATSSRTITDGDHPTETQTTQKKTKAFKEAYTKKSTSRTFADSQVYEYDVLAEFCNETSTESTITSLRNLFQVLYTADPDCLLRSDKEKIIKDPQDISAVTADTFTINTKKIGGSKSNVTKHIVCFTIRSALTLNKLKRTPQACSYLEQTKIFLKLHHWPLSEWDVVPIGWMLFKHPLRETDDAVISEITEQYEKIPATIEWPEDFQMVVYKGKPTIKTADGKTLKTDAHEIYVQKRFRQFAEKALTQIFMSTKTFIPLSMKYSDPTSYEQAIKFQKGYIHEFRSIKLTGLNKDMIFYIDDYITTIPGVISLTEGLGANTDGRYYVNTLSKHYKSVGTAIATKFKTWINLIPTDAIEMSPDTFSPPEQHFKAPKTSASKTPKPDKSHLNKYTRNIASTYDSWKNKGKTSIDSDTIPYRPPSNSTPKPTWSAIVSANTKARPTYCSPSPQTTDTTPPNISYVQIPTDDISTLSNEIDSMKAEITALRKLLLTLHPELCPPKTNFTPNMEHTTSTPVTTETSVMTDTTSAHSRESKRSTPTLEEHRPKRIDSKITPTKAILPSEEPPDEQLILNLMDCPPTPPPRSFDTIMASPSDAVMDDIALNIDEQIFQSHKEKENHQIHDRMKKKPPKSSSKLSKIFSTITSTTQPIPPLPYNSPTKDEAVSSLQQSLSLEKARSKP